MRGANGCRQGSSGVYASGLSEVDLAAEGTTDDRAATGPFSAAIDVAPAINPMESTISVNRADGVTRAIVAPNTARSIFAGQGAVIDLGATATETAARKFQFVELGEGGATPPGARAHRLIYCSATPFAKPPNWADSRLAVQAAREQRKTPSCAIRTSRE